MTRCKQCLTKTEPRDGLCRVCGIDHAKPASELSPQDIKVRRHLHAILFLAILHLIGAVAGFITFIRMPGSSLGRTSLILGLISALLFYGLSRYSLWAYRIAAVVYFGMGMVNLITINLGGILISLIALYLIGNGTAKAIFERRLPEPV